MGRQEGGKGKGFLFALSPLPLNLFPTSEGLVFSLFPFPFNLFPQECKKHFCNAQCPILTQLNLELLPANVDEWILMQLRLIQGDCSFYKYIVAAKWNHRE